MKTVIYTRGLAALALSICAAGAQANMELARQKNCLNCHQIDSKLIGPPYKQVAAKYKGDPEAENRLVKKVLEGSFGAWGQIPMPANPVSEGEARTLVKWVLSQ
jgi:cytochrome c